VKNQKLAKWIFGVVNEFPKNLKVSEEEAEKIVAHFC